MNRLLTEVVPEIIEIVEELNGDVIILVTSNIYGGGKSTIALMLAKAIWASFTFSRHVTYTLIDFLKMLINKRIRVQVQDEGKRLGKRTDFMKKDTRVLEDILSETRKFNKVIIICVGEMKRLFKWLANDRAVLWLHIPQRGRIMVFQARSHIIEGNKFGIGEKTLKDVKDKTDLNRRLRALPSYRFVDSFPQYMPGLLTKEEFVEYEAMAENATLDFIEDVIKDMQKEKKSGRAIDYEKIYNEVFVEREKFLQTRGGRTFISTSKIEAAYNVSYAVSKKVKAQVEKMLGI